MTTHFPTNPTTPPGMNPNADTSGNSNGRTRAIQRILNSRGVVEPEPAPAASERAPAPSQAAFIESGGKPQAAFSLKLANGEMHGFQYFNIDNLKFSPGRGGRDYLSFDHRGKVVVIKGRGLAAIYRAVVQQVLVEARDDVDTQDCDTAISKIDITSLDRGDPLTDRLTT